MADDIVGGLFGVNPEMYQQQQQQQVFNRAVALQNLNPLQQASVGIQQAGYNLAGALGGALGGVDPQLQRISTLNAISKQIDQSNPESMLQGAKLLADAGFTQEALGLAQYARKANSEIALAQQRLKEGRAAAIPKEVQIAEYSANLKTQLGQLQAMEQTPEVANAIALLQNRLDALPQPKEAAVSTNIQDSLEIGRLVGKIDELDKLPPDLQDPTRKKQLEAQLGSLTKNTKQGEFAQILQDAGFIPGSQEYKDKMTDFVNLKLAEKPETKTEALKNAIAFADFSPFKKGTFEYNQLVKEKFDEYVEKTKADRAPPSVGTDAERISLEKFGKNYYDLNTEQRAVVNKIVDAKEPSGKVTITNVLPGAEKLGDVPKFRSDVQRTIDPQLKVIDATDNALAAIDDSIKNNNFSSFRAAQTQFARAISGGGDLSQKELLAAGADPAILGGTADYLSKLVSGTPTLDTQNSIRKTLIAIRKVSVDKAQAEIKAQRSIADLQKYPPAALDAALSFPQLKPYQGGAKASKTLTTQSGKTVTVTEE